MLDKLPLGNISNQSRTLTQIAREIRRDPVSHMIVENSLIYRMTDSVEHYQDVVTRNYLGEDYDRYLELLRDANRVEGLLQTVEPAIARVSPICLALVLGKERRNPYDPIAPARYTSNALVAAIAGRCPTTIIAEWPPRHGKTTLISRRAAEWILCNDPSKSVGICGYSDAFAGEHGRTARNDVKDSPGVFGFGIADDSSAAAAWHTEYGGSLWTAGVHGSATGRGADLLIIDDPVKDAADANSLAARDENWAWYTSTARTRLQQGGITCLIMTRWHEDDLAGRVLANAAPNETVEIKFPAICEKDSDELGRTKGAALWPSRYPVETLLKTQRDVGPESWMALYQQSPLGASRVGRVYSAFEPSLHVRPCAEDFDPNLEVMIGWDFNVNPLAIVLGQGLDITHWRNTTRQYILKIFDELSLPDCNTASGVDTLGERLLRWAHGFKLRLRITGDASGARRQTSATNLGGDHQIIKDYFNRRTGFFRVQYDFAKSNLSVRESVMQVNTQMRTADGHVHFEIDPRCRETIVDLTSNRWRRDSNGNFLDTIDDKDPRRTHSGDALRYLIRSMRKGSIRYGEQAQECPR